MTRPPILYPLFADVASLPSIGPRYAERLAHLCGGNRVLDLIYHLPLEVQERKILTQVGRTALPSLVTIPLTIAEHRPPDGKRRPYKVITQDAAGRIITLTFFHGEQNYLLRQLPIASKRLISGKLESVEGRLGITHPDYIVAENEGTRIPQKEAIYPLTQGISQKVLLKALHKALETLPVLPEWLDKSLLAEKKWASWGESLKTVHAPRENDDTSPHTPAKERLAFDELLAHQLSLKIARQSKAQASTPLNPPRTLIAKALQHLPFALTEAQLSALEEILGDMAGNAQMVRLLQGDVGSGKTIVAFLAALTAIEAGFQAAIMVPTEILAQQHAASFALLSEALQIPVATLTGRDKGKSREKLLSSIASGSIPLVIGTHALFQEDVAFHKLGLVVIDEQHRFGVHQRLTLTAKGKAPHLLVMTATPIPRTLLLTQYNDMTTSKILTKPAGRKPIHTTTVSLDRLNEMVERLKGALAGGAKVYWVCPLVEQSELLDLAAVTERYQDLTKIFGAQVGLLHGRMTGDEKEAVIKEFTEGTVNLLVATTVIEVGVNVPQATIILIEHAERFGLAQLHQLRGRVGRSDVQGHCVLLYGKPLGKVSQRRLQIMKETNDGFVLAEEDLKLRGAGDMLGTKQSGMPSFKVADVVEHADLLALAHNQAKLILHRDPTLQNPEIRLLLELFQPSHQTSYLAAG